jgi:hypothetical protein
VHFANAKAELIGILATNKKLTMSVIEMIASLAARSEAAEMCDTLDMMQQLADAAFKI